MPRIETLSCPSCGGVVLKPQKGFLSQCEFCKGKFFFEDDDYIPEYLVMPSKNPHPAELIKKVSGSKYIPKDFLTNARIISCENYFLPYYRASGIRAGIIEVEILKEINTYDSKIEHYSSRWTSDNPRIPLLKINEIKNKPSGDTRSVMGDFEYFFRGATLQSWDIEPINLKEKVSENIKILPREPRRDATLGHFIKPDIPIERIKERGIESFETSKAKMETIDVHWDILYYPVISIIFQYKRKTYDCLFDGIGHAPISGRFPYNPNLSLMAGTFLNSFGSLLIGSSLIIFQSIFTEDLPSSFPFLIAMAVFTAGSSLLVISWNLLTSPFVLEYGKGGFLVRGLGTLFSKIIGESKETVE